MNPTNGKGSERRKENTKQVENNLSSVRFGVRDKSQDTFRVKVNGKFQVDPEEEINQFLHDDDLPEMLKDQAI